MYLGTLIIYQDRYVDKVLRSIYILQILPS